MKTKTPAPVAKVREIRPDYREVVYSAGASAIMDQITGTRSPRPAAAPKPVVAATD